MTTQAYPSAALLLSTLFLLTACGGGGGGSATVSPLQEQPPVEPPPLPKTPGLLKRVAESEELADAMRKGMLQNQVYYINPPGSVDFSSGPPTAEGATPGSFSTTNIQEAAVDEADVVKYDGRTLYVSDFVTNEERNNNDEAIGGIALAPYSGVTPIIRRYQTHPADASFLSLSDIALSEGEQIPELYLRESNDEKQLLAITRRYSFDDWGVFSDYRYWQSQSTRVHAWDVSDSDSPQDQFSLLLEGALIASRRIDDKLYLITRHAPVIEGLNAFSADESVQAANVSILEETPATAFLPRYSLNGNEAQPLVEGTDCYVPNPDFDGEDLLASSSSIVTLVTVNLSQPGQVDAICLNGYANGFYVSQHNLYLTTNLSDDKTLIHKIALNDGDPEYRGSGTIIGRVGTSNPSYLMSEHEGNLRVVSSTWEGRFFDFPVMPSPAEEASEPANEETDDEEIFGRHHLTVLRESDTAEALEQVVRLPNAQRPQEIGKPGEDIFSARFFGDRAYLVTFRQIDPLYVIDLTTADDPAIAGELEIPGVSTALQPLGDGLLLGVGKEVTNDPGSPALFQGLKVALYDVSDIGNPVEVSKTVIGERGTYSPAEYNYRALTLLEREGDYRVALPIQRYATPRNGYFEWTDSALYEFFVDTAAKSLNQEARIVSETRSDQTPYPVRSINNSRAVIHDDAVYFVVGDNADVLSALWGSEP